MHTCESSCAGGLQSEVSPRQKMGDPIQKWTKSKKRLGVCLESECEALSSNPSTTKTNEKRGTNQLKDQHINEWNRDYKNNRQDQGN
jgi:hypothetical protein